MIFFIFLVKLWCVFFVKVGIIRWIIELLFVGLIFKFDLLIVCLIFLIDDLLNGDIKRIWVFGIVIEVNWLSGVGVL